MFRLALLCIPLCEPGSGTSNDLILPPVDGRIDGDEYRAEGFYGEAL